MAPTLAPGRVPAYSIDRSDEADRIIEYVLDKHLAILSGRRGSRRRELVREWVIPRLEGKRDAYYADCDGDLPAVVAGLKGELSLEDALRAGATVFLGRMEQGLSALDPAKERRLAELLNRLDKGELAGTLVLVVPEGSIAEILRFQGAAPSLLANLVMIAVVTFRQSLSRLSAAAGGSHLQYTPEAVDALASEVERNTAGDGVELARAVDQGFVHFKGPVGTVTAEECKAIGGTAGALDEYRQAQLDKAEERWGEQGSKTVEVILFEVTSSASTGAEPDLTDLALRLGITEAKFAEVLDWLGGEGQMLRSQGDRQWEIVPAELRPLLEQQAARKVRDVMRAWALVRDGVRSWSQLGTVLPRKRLDEIEAVREWLPATAEEAALIVRSLLRVDGVEETCSIRYWLGRIRSEAVEISTLVEALFADAPTVRARAARLLSGFDNPDVRCNLYRLATEDQEREVRLAALTSLAAMRVDELWPLVSQEARDLESPYQLNAVAALRLFPDERAIALLSDLVASRDHRPEVRTEAIDTLGALGTSGAVQALVEIGLNDEDAEDRLNAAGALSRISSAERAREAVDAIRDSTVRREHAGPLTVRRTAGIAFRSVLSVIVGVLNIIVHGAALLALRRYVAGLAFLVCELLLWVSIKTDWLGGSEGWMLLMAVNWLACQLMATRIAISDQERRLEEWERPLEDDKFARWELRTPLTITLLVIDLGPFLIMHGLAQAMKGHLTRAMRLFGLEFFGLACITGGLYFFSGRYAPITPFPKLVSDPFLIIYIAVGFLLFMGSFLWDLFPVVNAVIISAGRLHGWERRTALYQRLAANPSAAEYILQSAGWRSEPHSRWARRLVERTAHLMPLDSVLGSLGAQDRRPAYLVRALKRMKDETAVVKAVHKQWSQARPRLRRWIIDILAGMPNEASLTQLSALRADLPWYGRLRYPFALLHYRLRLWPGTVILVSLLFVPLALLAAYEVKKTMENPARPALRMIQTAEVRANMPLAQITEILHFASKTHPEACSQDLIDLLNDRAGTTPEYREAVAESLGTAVCTLPSGSHNKERHRLISALIAGLKNAPPHLEVARGLAEIEHTPGCSVTGSSKNELAQAASDLLKRATTGDQVQAAITGLSASGDPDVVDRLRKLVLGLTERKTPDQIQWTSLRERALYVLNANPSPKAAEALSEIASQASPGASEDMKSIAEQAAKFVKQRYQDRLDQVRLPLRRGEYRDAYNIALEMLKDAPPPELRVGLIDILGQASYQLANSGTQTGDWPSEAIKYLPQTKGTVFWDKDKPRMLSNSYAIRAERVYAENSKRDPSGAFNAAFNDAQHAIREDPESSLGYSIRAWLLQQKGRYKDSLEDVLTAIRKDPTTSWSYDLLQNFYQQQANAAASSDESKRIFTQAAGHFDQLASKYPRVMWPRRRLVNIYHDLIATPEALEKSYDLYVEMEKQFADQLTDRDKLIFNSNFLEARFTVGHYREVADAGAALDKQVAANDYELRIPVNVLRYSALVMLGETKSAAAELSVLERLVSQLPRDYELTWSYSGTLAYLRSQPLESEMQKKMLGLVNAADSLKKDRRLPPEVIAANRSALQASMPRVALRPKQ